MVADRTMSSTYTHISIFPRFNELPAELRHRTWFLALPGPRIVYVQRRLISGQDAEMEWYSTTGEDPPADTYFMSPSSSHQIIMLLQTCRESRFVAKKNCTLLFPSSSTWFSFRSDFLHLDFGQSPHTMRYKPRAFTTSIPEPWHIAKDSKLSRYLRPRFDPELVKKAKNLAINTYFDKFDNFCKRVLHELLAVLTGVEVLVLADQLYVLCHEYDEELVWLKGQLGDEINSLTELDKNESSSLTQPWENTHSKASRQELKTEKEHRHLLTNLLLWTRSIQYNVLKDKEMDSLLQEIEKVATRKMPLVVRRSITTAKTKTRLLAICGSEDNFEALTSLDCEFVHGQHEYSGSLDLYQQFGFLELVLEMITAIIDTNCCSNIEGGDTLENDIPFLLYRIDMLVLEIMRLQ